MKRFSGAEWWEIDVSRDLVDLPEDCLLTVCWKYEYDFFADGSSKVRVVSVDDAIGQTTGKDYGPEVQVSRVLLEHLSDLITEKLEM